MTATTQTLPVATNLHTINLTKDSLSALNVVKKGAKRSLSHCLSTIPVLNFTMPTLLGNSGSLLVAAQALGNTIGPFTVKLHTVTQG